MDNNKRFCYYIMEGQTTIDGGYIPSMIVENEAGHTPLTGPEAVGSSWVWAHNFEDAKQYASVMNTQLGLTQDDVMDIVASSMRAGAVA